MAGAGSNETIHGTTQTLLPCTPEAYATLRRLREVCPSAEVSLSLNSYLTEHDNTVCGWFVKLPPTTPASVIPFGSNMFEGVTVVETMASEDEILDLLKHRTTTLQKVSETAERFLATKNTNRASWYRCRPQRALPLQRTNTWHVVMHQENLSRYTTVGATGNSVTMSHNAPLDLVPDDTVPNYIDSADWVPELSAGGAIGLYHQWYTNGNGRRELKLYIVCHSACQIAGLEVKQIVNDIPRGTTAYDLATSEEIWWLENINARNRNRLIAQLAADLGIAIPLIEDCHAARPMKMAQPLTQTLIHGIYNYRDGAVGVANECMPTSFVSNGVVCKMSPWEGYFIFKGPHATHGTRFGTAFGTPLDTFPVTATRLSAHTEPVARKMRYIVQSSSPAGNSFWADPSHVAAVRGGGAQEGVLGRGAVESDDDGGGGDGEDGGDEGGELAGSDGFVWTGDPALQKVAMQIWQKTKRSELASQEAQHAGTVPAPARADSGELSYISFDDHVVLSRLADVHWDQRYGVLRLVPLCVFTNGLFR